MLNMIKGDFIPFYRWLKSNGFDVREEELDGGKIASFSSGKYSGVITEYKGKEELSVPSSGREEELYRKYSGVLTEYAGKEQLSMPSGHEEELYRNFRVGFRYLLGVEIPLTQKLEKRIILSGIDPKLFDHYRILYCKNGEWKVNGVCGRYRENVFSGSFRIARMLLGENFLDVYWDKRKEQGVEDGE